MSEESDSARLVVFLAVDFFAAVFLAGDFAAFLAAAFFTGGSVPAPGVSAAWSGAGRGLVLVGSGPVWSALASPAPVVSSLSSTG